MVSGVSTVTCGVVSEDGFMEEIERRRILGIRTNCGLRWEEFERECRASAPCGFRGY